MTPDIKNVYSFLLIIEKTGKDDGIFLCRHFYQEKSHILKSLGIYPPNHPLFHLPMDPHEHTGLIKKLQLQRMHNNFTLSTPPKTCFFQLHGITTLSPTSKSPWFKSQLKLYKAFMHKTCIFVSMAHTSYKTSELFLIFTINYPFLISKCSCEVTFKTRISMAPTYCNSHEDYGLTVTVVPPEFRQNSNKILIRLISRASHAKLLFSFAHQGKVRLHITR